MTGTNDRDQGPGPMTRTNARGERPMTKDHPSCLFCRIIAREIPGSIVYEDEAVLAFNDINPQAPTPVLVVPRRHIETLNDLQPGDDQIVGELVRRAAAIAKERGISGPGFRT